MRVPVDSRALPTTQFRRETPLWARGTERMQVYWNPCRKAPSSKSSPAVSSADWSREPNGSKSG